MGKANTITEENVAAVSKQVPAFMHAVVDEWFAICEAPFELGHIKNGSTKLFLVLSLVPPEFMISLPFTIKARKDYARLKDTVMTKHETPQLETFKKLMTSSQMTSLNWKIETINIHRYWW